MQCYTQLVPPTAVNACVSLPFTSATANNLIVAKSSLLQVFSLKSVLTEIDTQSSDGPAARKERAHTSKLILVAQYELSGTVTALGRVKIKSKSEGDLLLVALKDAKLSLLEWDPERHAISTISIHYYERDDVSSALWDADLNHHSSVLSVDPGSRCAAFKFGARHLALLPFRQAGFELGIDEVDGTIDNNQKGVSNTSNEVSDLAVKIVPTAKSFVLSLLSLDPTLAHPIDLAFVYGYRDPTLAVLSSVVALSSNLLSERRDTVAFTVYTLDIEQRASTTLLSVTGLPYDLCSVVPLPPPIGGVLLVGTNEIIHVDQAGKANALAVNDIAKQTTSFPLVQQAGLNLGLEECVVKSTGSASGDVLIALATGEVYVLSFTVDSRTISGLSLHRPKSADDKPLLLGASSCAANVGRGRCFIGSEQTDSVVLGFTSGTKQLHRKQSHVEVNGDVYSNGFEGEATEEDVEDDDDDEEEDDLYAPTKTSKASSTAPSASASSNGQDYVFRIHDRMINLAPLASPQLINGDSRDRPRKELFASSGGSERSALVKLSPFLDLYHVETSVLSDIDGAWSLTVKGGTTTGASAHHNVLVTSRTLPEGGESHVYRIGKHNAVAEIEGGEFDSSAGACVDVAMFMDGTRIVQILETEVRAFDEDFGLAQICPLFEDEALDRAPKVLAASFAEPYILLLRDDARITILKADDSGDLEEMELTDNLMGTRWMSGCLYDDPKDELHLDPEDNDEEDPSSILAFLLTEDGGLQVYQLPNTKVAVYNAPGLSFVPPYLSSDFNLRRPAKDREDVVEILVAELGDSVAKAPYLILRSNANDLSLYQSFQYQAAGVSSALRFMKVPHTFLPKAVSEDEEEEQGIGQNRQRLQPMRVIGDLNGFSSVVMPGASTSLVLKSAASHPQILDLKTENLRYVSAFNTSSCPSGIIYANEVGKLCCANMPPAMDYSTGWCIQRTFEADFHIGSFAQHSGSGHFVLGASRMVEYKLPHDELHPEWDLEELCFSPRLERGSIELLNPKTWKIEDTYEFEVGEMVMSLKAHSLEVTEVSHHQRPLIVVGTALVQGEDSPVQGRAYVFDVVDVVPDPDQGGKLVRLKLISMEEFRGGVTAMSPIGSEGLMMVAQGQKCIVRGLTEGNDFLPAAALDVQCYVSQVKELPGSGLSIIADALKGLWFAGYNESPYNIRLFGRSKNDIQVMATDFLPDQDRLYILLSDSDGILHNLQFDPHNPRSLAGQRLLPLSTFNSGTDLNDLTLLPRQPATYEALAALTPGAMDVDFGYALHQLLATSKDGSISLITPLSTRAYSTLTALQTYMSNTLQHPLSLNPRAWRNAEADRSIGGCLTIDGNVLKQWMDLGSWKRAEGLRRTGLDQDWELRMVLEGVGVRGLGYL